MIAFGPDNKSFGSTLELVLLLSPPFSECDLDSLGRSNEFCPSDAGWMGVNGVNGVNDKEFPWSKNIEMVFFLNLPNFEVDSLGPIVLYPGF